MASQSAIGLLISSSTNLLKEELISRDLSTPYIRKSASSGDSPPWKALALQ